MAVKTKIALVALLPLLMVSCGLEQTKEEKLAIVFSESACVAKQAQTLVINAMGDKNIDFTTLNQKADELKAKMDEIRKTYFNSSKEMEETYATIADKTAFAKKVLDDAQSKCQAGEDIVSRMMKDVKAAVDKKTGATNENTNTTTTENSNTNSTATNSNENKVLNTNMEVSANMNLNLNSNSN